MPAEAQPDSAIVVAAYDRRSESDSGTHGAPLKKDQSVVAAVCDRRVQSLPVLTERRYSAAACGRLEENDHDSLRDAATKQPLRDGGHRQPIQRPRLRRLDRVFVDSPIYFVTACTHDRREILTLDITHKAFRTFCLNSPQHGARVGGYVLMPDHLHQFVCLEGITLADWVKSLKNGLSKTLRSAGHEGPHWQKGFFDHLLRSGESYSKKWDYVRENPVRAGLASTHEAWPYAGEIDELEYRQ